MNWTDRPARGPGMYFVAPRWPGRVVTVAEYHGDDAPFQVDLMGSDKLYAPADFLWGDKIPLPEAPK